MQALAEDAPRRAVMSGAARQVALDHGWEAMAGRYLDVLEAARDG
jgi:glycosyltransferase involved in cell wall biosynthesis